MEKTGYEVVDNLILNGWKMIMCYDWMETEIELQKDNLILTFESHDYFQPVELTRITTFSDSHFKTVYRSNEE